MGNNNLKILLPAKGVKEKIGGENWRNFQKERGDTGKC
jgi:hypothetical protein